MKPYGRHASPDGPWALRQLAEAGEPRALCLPTPRTAGPGCTRSGIGSVANARPVNAGSVLVFVVVFVFLAIMIVVVMIVIVIVIVGDFSAVG